MISVHQSSFVTQESTLHDVLVAIDGSEHGLALVVDKKKRLLGILTHFEVRKALIGGTALDAVCWDFTNQEPVTAGIGLPSEELQDLFHTSSKQVIPLLDREGCVVGLETIGSVVFASETITGRIAVIVAGGLGSRMGKLTAERPKPLLPIGEKSILEIIIEELRRHGFTRLYVSVNFQHEMIKDSLRDGENLGVEIEYLYEETPLGTAGGLSMLPESLSEPFLVMNGDLLTRVNSAGFLDYHQRSGEVMTMGIQRYDFEVPFGVVNFEDDRITSISEKPAHSWFINAGIYALNPEVLQLLSPGRPCDMPDLVTRVIDRWGGIGAFPIYEYWLDIGKPTALMQAERDYSRHF